MSWCKHNLMNKMHGETVKFKDLYFFKPSHYLHIGFPNVFGEKATPVIVGWFAGGTWKNNYKWCTCLNCMKFF